MVERAFGAPLRRGSKVGPGLCRAVAAATGILVLLGLTGCGKKPAAGGGMPPTPVGLTKARTADAPLTLKGVGHVTPITEVIVRPQVTATILQRHDILNVLIAKDGLVDPEFGRHRRALGAVETRVCAPVGISAVVLRIRIPNRNETPVAQLCHHRRGLVCGLSRIDQLHVAVGCGTVLRRCNVKVDMRPVAGQTPAVRDLD